MWKFLKKKLFGNVVNADNNSVVVNGNTVAGSIVINGNNISGTNISVRNGVVTIDGVVQKGHGSNILEIHVKQGFINNLVTDASVSCGDVRGNVSAGGSVNCDDIGGDVIVGGSLNCDDIGGNVDVRGSINRS